MSELSSFLLEAGKARWQRICRPLKTPWIVPAWCSAPLSLYLRISGEILWKPGISGRVCAVVVDEAHCVSKWYVRSCTG